MCDTALAPPGTTSRNAMLFGKNSDRQCNEAQAVELHPARGHEVGTQVACTYLTIAQAQRTHAVLLCRPFWIWGAEMGANEHGVLIGNEGIHARTPGPETPALTGMDLVRLALERAASAAEAVQVITTLLERHGQGGNCGHLTPVFYNNGFMVADRSEAFVLETVGREWLVERVSGVRAMSNAFSIGRQVHARSAGLDAMLRESGWSTEIAPDYAAAIANPHREHIGNAGARRACSTSLLTAREGRVRLEDVMCILRDHGTGARYHPEWLPECTIKRTVCMHAGADSNGQTVGSMVSELHDGHAVHWVTGTAAPCISIFKPVMLDVDLPQHGPLPTDRFDVATLWWRHERLHRQALLGDFTHFLDQIRAERDALEAAFRVRIDAVLAADEVQRARAIAECWREADEMEACWYRKMVSMPTVQDARYVSAWSRMNELARL